MTQQSLPYLPPAPALFGASGSSNAVAVTATFSSAITGIAASDFNLITSCPSGWVSGGDAVVARCWKVTTVATSFAGAAAQCGPGAYAAELLSTKDDTKARSLCPAGGCFVGTRLGVLRRAPMAPALSSCSRYVGGSHTEQGFLMRSTRARGSTPVRCVVLRCARREGSLDCLAC